MPKTKDPPLGSRGGLSRRTLLGHDALCDSIQEHKKQDVDERIIVDVKARESQKSLHFKWNLRDLYEPLRDECGFDKSMAAAAIALGLEGKWTSYSRRKAWYPGKSSRYHDGLMTYANVVGAMDRLDAAGLINHAKAAPGARGWQSAAQAKPELIRRVHDIMHGRPRLVLSPPRETIILRGEDGDNIEYRDTREHDRARRFVESMNEALAATNIPTWAAAPMTRIYNLNFRRGGRFYALGGGWQSLPKAVRKAVTINGEEVAELDYSALHPSILYAYVGHPMPSGGCYNVGKWPRPLAKGSAADNAEREG